jgi:hypothetical protein
MACGFFIMFWVAIAALLVCPAKDAPFSIVRGQRAKVFSF